MRALLLAAAVAAAPLVQTSTAVAQTAQATADFTAPAQTFGRVSFDARSLMIDGKRLVVWSSEMHPFRLPRHWHRELLQVSVGKDACDQTDQPTWITLADRREGLPARIGGVERLDTAFTSF